MPYAITELCVGTKDASCVDVCPVDCIHPSPDDDGFDAAAQLYIDPTECIDCDACFGACPVAAPAPLEEISDPEAIRRNAAYFEEGSTA
jgi:NAD-dependent dihydropyrimidine dehydrogenase PreA subunit